MIKQVYQKGRTHKCKTKNDQNIYFRGDLSQRQEKLLKQTEKKAYWFLIIEKFYLFLNPIKVNLLCMSLEKLPIIFIITHCSCFKCYDILHTLNVDQISAKEHQLPDSWAADEISVSEILFWKNFKYVSLILRICKKTKEDKNLKI